MRKALPNRKSILLIIVLMIQFLCFYILKPADFLMLCADAFFKFQQNALGFLSYINFSVGDVLYVLFGFYLLRLIYLMLRQKSLQKLGHLLLFANIALLYYQMSWGLLYHQSPIPCAKTPENTNLQEVISLAKKYSQLSSQSRRAYSLSAQFKMDDVSPIFNAILQAQRALPKPLQKKNIRQSPWQSSLFSVTMNYTGILGYFNPFSHQAQYNGHAPHSGLPFTLGHEFAHAMGYAREQEANYISFKMSQTSPNMAYRYSGQLYALKSLLSICKQQDVAVFQSLKKNVDPLVWQDIMAEKAFYQSHQTWLTDAFLALNDWFLKSNQQEGSITYSYFVYLLLNDEVLKQ